MKVELEQESMDKTFKNLPVMAAFDVCVNIHRLKLGCWLDERIAFVKQKENINDLMKEIGDMNYISFDTSKDGVLVYRNGITLENPPTPKWGFKE